MPSLLLPGAPALEGATIPGLVPGRPDAVGVEPAPLPAGAVEPEVSLAELAEPGTAPALVLGRAVSLADGT